MTNTYCIVFRPRPHPHMVSMVTHQQQQAQPQGWWEWLVNWAFFPVRLVISTFNELTQLIRKLTIFFSMTITLVVSSS